MIQACVIEILLFSKIDLVFLKISSSFACAKRKTTTRMKSTRNKCLNPRIIKDKPKLFECKMGKLVFLNKK